MRALPALLLAAVAASCSSTPPAAVTCTGATTPCGSSCAALATDDANCGSCGHACGASETCGGGACLPADCSQVDCEPTQACYQEACVEKACVGVVCPAGQACSQGVCGCASTHQSCDGQCVNTASDVAHCGRCGNACGADERCAAGQCFPSACGAVTCDPLSVCYQGGCVESACVGVVCPGGQACRGGVCECAAGLTACGGACANLAADATHCGVCGTRCGATETCINGACVATGCTPGQKSCAGACVDPMTDPNHCGACGAACGGGRVCVGGACQCPMGLTYCQGQCVDLQTDPDHCNVCGNTCAGASCVAGACTCPAGKTVCGIACVDLASDPANCGTCGRTCGTGATCANNTCGCPAGTTLCGGACIPTAADNLNCGGCGTTCPQGQTCSGSMCRPEVTCQANFNAAPSDCARFPLDIAGCGAVTMTSGTPFTGAVAMGQSGTFMLSGFAQNERVEVRGGLVNNNCGGETAVRNASTAIIVQQNGGGGTVVDLGANGSVYACANPASVTIRNTGCTLAGNLTYNLQVDRFSYAGKYNTGGNNAGAAAVLATDATSGRVCDQVCGALQGSCGDSRQYYKLTLPAGKAAVIEAVFTGRGTTSTFDLTANDGAGGFLCELVTNGTASATPSTYRARLVNNTSAAKVVLLTPVINTGNITWNMAVAVEP